MTPTSSSSIIIDTATLTTGTELSIGIKLLPDGTVRVTSTSQAIPTNFAASAKSVFVTPTRAAKQPTNKEEDINVEVASENPPSSPPVRTTPVPADIFPNHIRSFIQIMVAKQNSMKENLFYAYAPNADPDAERYNTVFPLNTSYGESTRVKKLGALWNPTLHIWYVPPFVPTTDFDAWITPKTREAMTVYRFNPDPSRIKTSSTAKPNLPQPNDKPHTSWTTSGESYKPVPSVCIPTPKPATAKTAAQASTSDNEFGETYKELDGNLTTDIDNNVKLNLSFINETFPKCPKCQEPIDLNDVNTVKIRCPNTVCNHTYCKVCLDPWSNLHGSETGGLASCNRVAIGNKPTTYKTAQKPKPRSTAAALANQRLSKQAQTKTKRRNEDEEEEDSSQGNNTYQDDSWCDNGDRSDSGASYHPPEASDDHSKSDYEEASDESTSKYSNDEDCDYNKNEDGSEAPFSDDYSSSEYDSEDSSEGVVYMGTKMCAAKNEESDNSEGSSVELVGVVKKELKLKKEKPPMRDRNFLVSNGKATKTKRLQPKKSKHRHTLEHQGYQMVKQIRKGTNAKEGKEAKVQKKKQIKKHDKKHNQYKSRGVK